MRSRHAHPGRSAHKIWPNAAGIRNDYRVNHGQENLILLSEDYFAAAMADLLPRPGTVIKFGDIAKNRKQDFFLRTLEHSKDERAFEIGKRFIQDTNEIVYAQSGMARFVAAKFQDRFIYEALQIWVGQRKDLTPPPEDKESMAFYALFKDGPKEQIDALKAIAAERNAPAVVAQEKGLGLGQKIALRGSFAAMALAAGLLIPTNQAHTSARHEGLRGSIDTLPHQNTLLTAEPSR